MRKLLLALLALALLAAPAAYGATRGVRVIDNAFSPKTLSMRSGDTVKFTWAGRRPHNVRVTSGPSRFSVGVRRSGTYSKRLTRRGTYRIVCDLHAGMRMTLSVR